MRGYLYGACVVMCSLFLASCETGVSPVGEPPLTGIWLPSGIAFVCGVDTPCELRLRLFGAKVTGAYEQRVFFEQDWGGVPLRGTFDRPSVHLEWNEPYTTTYDGEVRGDTLMVGILRYYNGQSDSLQWERSR